MRCVENEEQSVLSHVDMENVIFPTVSSWFECFPNSSVRSRSGWSTSFASTF